MTGVAVLVSLAATPAGADALSDKLQAVADDAVAHDGLTGVIVAVQLSGAPATIVTSGLADSAKHVPMAPTSLFKIASIAKSFLAALALKLQDEGRLTLDDKLSLYLPDIPNAGRVTLRQLMNHSSGYDDFLSDAFIAAAKAAPDKDWSARELIGFARPEHLRFTPGSRYDYSNTNYLLLGLALEAAAKEPLAAALKRRFFEPLGLTSTWMGSLAEVPRDRLAHGYADTDDSGARRDVTDQAYAVGGADGVMLSDAADLIAWCRALFEHRALPRKDVLEMLSSSAPDADAAPGSSYGLGVERFGVDGVEFMGHTGSREGYNSVMLFQPGTHLVLVIAFNDDPADEALLDIMLERAVKAIEASGLLHFPRQPDDASAAPAAPVPAAAPSPMPAAAPLPRPPKPPQPPSKG
jgi:D-alanyl-D-alanine carboxypeptidase